MIGTMVGQYQVLQMLGEGGMGTVYKAMDVNLERLVALKFIHSSVDARSDVAERFRVEARTHASIQHPNIATLYAFLVWEAKPVIVMEFINGETLLQRIQRQGPMQVEQVVPLLQQALLGLSAAHALNVVHRDIKPQNLMIDYCGVLKVMDFGIAKVQGQKGLTGTHMAPGTLWYMAPEQIRNRGIDARTDIYAMGVTLYQALTGRVPFDAPSEFEIQQAHQEQAPVPPCDLNPAVPRALSSVTLRALAKAPGDRFQSAEEFRLALEDGVAAAGRSVGPQSRTMIERAPFADAPRTVPQPVAQKLPADEVQAISPAFGQGGQQRTPMYVAAVVLLLGAGGAWFWHGSAHHSGSASSDSSSREAEAAKPVSAVPPPAPTVPPKHTQIAAAAPQGPRNLEAKPIAIPPTSGDSGVAKKIDSAPSPAPRPVAPAAAELGGGLSGTWEGTFFDPNLNAQSSTGVTLRLKEESSAKLSGSLSYKLASNAEGRCAISPTQSLFDADAGSLKLVTTGCGADVPAFLRTPVVFHGVSPTTTKLLSGHPQLIMTSVTANLRKTSQP